MTTVTESAKPQDIHTEGVTMAGSILGEQVLRKEDPKFLTTGGVIVQVASICLDL